MRGKGLGKIANIKVVLNGGEQISFIRQQDGSFALYPFYIIQLHCFV